MGGRADARGVSEVLGAILVFSVLVALLALFQITIVPAQNEEIEFKHNQEVQGQMQDVRSAIRGAAVTGSSQSASVDLGPQYPSRILLLNPSSGSGTIRAETGLPMEVDNAVALDGETADYLDGGLKPFQTGGLGFRPAYNYYDNAPVTFYENSVAYNRFESGEVITMTDQQLINGRRITLTTLDGRRSVSKTGEVTLDAKPLSPATTTVAVEDDGSGPITITIPTKLSENQWNHLLTGEPNVENVDCLTGAGPSDPCDGSLEIELKMGVTYNLRMAKIGIGSGTTDPSEKYMTIIGSSRVTVGENGEETITVQVRDEFNNPVSGVELSAGTRLDSTDSSISPITDNVTDESGQVTFLYTSNSNVHAVSTLEDEINVSFAHDPNASTFDPGELENVQLESVIENTDGSGIPGQSGINPNSTESVVFQSATVTGDNGVEITFENRDDQQRTMKEARFPFYDGDAQGGTGGEQPAEIDFRRSTNHELGGPFLEITDVVFAPDGDPGDDQTVTAEFFCDGGADYDIGHGDYFAISIIFENGDVNTYFVTPDGGTTGPATPCSGP